MLLEATCAATCAAIFEAIFAAMRTIQGGQYLSVAVTIREAVVTALAGAGGLVFRALVFRALGVR